MTAATHLDALLARRHRGLADATDRAALADALIEDGRDALAARVRAGESMTPAADRLTDEIRDGWTQDMICATAERGLAQIDAGLLRELCGEVETGSDYAESEADVMLYVLGHVAQVRMKAAEMDV